MQETVSVSMSLHTPSLSRICTPLASDGSGRTASRGRLCVVKMYLNHSLQNAFRSWSAECSNMQAQVMVAAKNLSHDVRSVQNVCASSSNFQIVPIMMRLYSEQVLPMFLLPCLYSNDGPSSAWGRGGGAFTAIVLCLTEGLGLQTQLQAW